MYWLLAGLLVLLWLLTAGATLAALLPGAGLQTKRYVAPLPPPPTPKTIRMSVCKLERDDVVLTQSTPFRYRMEKVLWLERQPFGPVVATLEGTDPETLSMQQRWHQWRREEMVTVLMGEVELEDYSGDQAQLYDKYSAEEPQVAEEPAAQEDLRPSMHELTFPWESAR
jgi:hypothetical protein